MPHYLQTERPLQVTTTLGADAFLLAAVQGEEAMSRPFLFRLDLRSENAEVDGKALLRTPMTVQIATGDNKPPRLVHGVVRRFVQLGRRDDLVAYEAEIVPWLWFLSLGRNCRIFQNMSAPDIVQKVFKDAGYSDFRLACSGSYDQREFCVQYRESDLDFVSRLLEEEGIFYLFEHEKTKHTLVLADTNNSVPTSATMPTARLAVAESGIHQDAITSFRREHAVHPGVVTVKDYDFLKPTNTLQGTISGTGAEEVYDYPGGFTARDKADRQARLRLEAEECLQHVVRGESTCRGLQAGTRFDVEEHFRADSNASYVIIEAVLAAKAGNFRGWEGESDFEYHNDFLAIPAKTPFRAQRRTPRPVVAGTQTAVVVGKAGEEIWVDKHSRVKVQFHWDREGKNDEKSSCWVRVATTWAGKSWGAIHIPRMGQEVVIAFLEGDPDRPLIVGSVYNAQEMPPYALPGDENISGIKSNSTKGGGGYNEIIFNDTKGSELFRVHAQKNKQVTVLNNRTESVGADESISIGGNRTESVAKDESITIEGNRTTSVTKDEALSVDGNRTETVAKDETIDVSGARTETVGKDESVSITGKRTVTVGKDDELSVSKKIVISAGDEITLVTGDAQLVMKKDGTVTIKGKDITIKGSGKVNVKADSDVVIKGSKASIN